MTKPNIKEIGLNTVLSWLNEQPSEYERLNEMYKNDKLIKEWSYKSKSEKESD